jgi:hypothetical protein
VLRKRAPAPGGHPDAGAEIKPWGGWPASHPAEPIVDVLLHLVLGIAVAGLDLALELLAVAVDLREVIVGELAPLCFHLAGDLLPIACDAVQFMDGSSTLIEA